MKTKNFLLAAALFLGSIVFNSADVAAQADIKSLDPSFQNGVEKYVGRVIPGSRDTIRLHDIGFINSEEVAFDPNSVSLAVDTAFFLSGVRTEGANNEFLFLTIGLALPQHVVYGQDLLDTLRISGAGLIPFVLPLRGSLVSFLASPSSLSFEEYVEPGGRSEAKPVVVLNLDTGVDSLVYTFGTEAFYATIVGHATGVPPSLTVLDVWFTPPAGDLVGDVFLDTLSITDLRDTTGWVQKIPVYGRSLHAKINPDRLDFGGEVVTFTKTLDLNVETREASIEGIVLTDARHFDVTRDSNWDPNKGGTLHVAFTPTDVQYYSAYLVILDDAHEPYLVPLTGEGTPQPLLSAVPPSIEFEPVEVGTRVDTVITVTLTNPLNHLDYNSFSFADPYSEIFRLVSVEPGTSSPDSEAVLATVSFTPNAEGDFHNTLFVQADYAGSISIELTGTGIESPTPQVPVDPSAASPRQVTALSGAEAVAAPVLSVREGDIVVSRAPAGSSIQVYNLDGQALKTQPVASDVEILKTASFPRSVYIVLVNDRKEVILRQKVVL